MKRPCSALREMDSRPPTCWRTSTRPKCRLLRSWPSSKLILRRKRRVCRCLRRRRIRRQRQLLSRWTKLHFHTGLLPRRFLMSITIEIPTPLRRLTAGTPRVVCTAGNLNDLFSELDRQFPDLKPHLRDEAGETRRFLNIYVNEEDIRFLGGASYSFQDGDEVLLVPSIAGGAQ